MRKWFVITGLAFVAVAVGIIAYVVQKTPRGSR
jgi:hypothetical protein